MKKRYLIFLFLVTATLMLLLSGCGNVSQSLEGKNIVTFELGGGTLEMTTSSVNTKINFAYYPNTYILDPADLPGYKIYRQGYNFTGWYTSAECKPQDKWDFEHTLFNQESLTLYAGWEKAILFTYTVCYTDGDNVVELDRYEVKAGEKFEDWRKFAYLRDDHTPIGYYKDAALSEEWDASFTHPGGETDTDVKVYVDYIEGKWTIVDTFSALRSAVAAGENIYLAGDIDCEGESWAISTLYKGIFEGNGFAVKNFKVEQSGTLMNPTCTIFSELGEGAHIRNVSFTDVTYVLENVNESAVKAVKVAALARSASGAKITNVTVTGKLTTNYSGELPKLNSAVFEENSTFEVSDFDASGITVEKKQ